MARRIDVTLEYQRYNGVMKARRVGKMLELLNAGQTNILGIKQIGKHCEFRKMREETIGTYSNSTVVYA